MIEHLDGMHETVDTRDATGIKLYDNIDFEEYPRHWHTCLEVVMPVSNSYTIHCDGNSFELDEGDILLICPGCLHHLEASNGRRYIFQAEVTPLYSIPDVKALMDRLYPAAIFTKEKSPECYPAFRKALEDIIAEYNAADPMYAASIYSRLLEIMVALSRNYTSMGYAPLGVNTNKQKEYLVKFTNVCTFIDEHCCDDLSLDMMAERAGFSKYHFTRLFKDFTGNSFYKYLNQRRIEHAAQLLINPENSITSVSFSSGFGSISSFIRMFKIVKGCTPSEYRSMYDL